MIRLTPVVGESVASASTASLTPECLSRHLLNGEIELPADDSTKAADSLWWEVVARPATFHATHATGETGQGLPEQSVVGTQCVLVAGHADRRAGPWTCGVDGHDVLLDDVRG